jgi:hypothetical protein
MTNIKLHKTGQPDGQHHNAHPLYHLQQLVRTTPLHTTRTLVGLWRVDVEWVSWVGRGDRWCALGRGVVVGRGGLFGMCCEACGVGAQRLAPLLLCGGINGGLWGRRVDGGEALKNGGVL